MHALFIKIKFAKEIGYISSLLTNFNLIHNHEKKIIHNHNHNTHKREKKRGISINLRSSISEVIARDRRGKERQKPVMEAAGA